MRPVTSIDSIHIAALLRCEALVGAAGGVGELTGLLVAADATAVHRRTVATLLAANHRDELTGSVVAADGGAVGGGLDVGVVAAVEATARGQCELPIGLAANEVVVDLGAFALIDFASDDGIGASATALGNLVAATVAKVHALLVAEAAVTRRCATADAGAAVLFVAGRGWKLANILSAQLDGVCTTVAVLETNVVAVALAVRRLVAAAFLAAPCWCLLGIRRGALEVEALVGAAGRKRELPGASVATEAVDDPSVLAEVVAAPRGHELARLGVATRSAIIDGRVGTLGCLGAARGRGKLAVVATANAGVVEPGVLAVDLGVIRLAANGTCTLLITAGFGSASCERGCGNNEGEER